MQLVYIKCGHIKHVIDCPPTKVTDQYMQVHTLSS